MKKHVILGAFIALMTACIHQQDLPVSGLKIPDSITYAKIPFVVLPVSPNFNVDPRHEATISGLPPVMNQGNLLSCASWACVYYLGSYYNKLKRGSPDYNVNGNLDGNKLFSPLYVHNQVLNCAGGCIKCESSNYDVLNFLSDKGAVSYKDFNIDDKPEPSRCAIIPNASLLAIAKQNKILGYGQIFNPLLHLPPGQKYNLIKNALLSNIPMVIGMSISDNFKRLDNRNYTWKTYNSTSTKEKHAMLCIGFSDTLNAIKIINSWGKGWGYDGVAWINASLLDDYLIEAYAVDVPDQFLISGSEMFNNSYASQAFGKSITVNHGKPLTPLPPVQINEGKYLQFNDLRIVPVRIADSSSIVKIYRKTGNKTELINFTTLTSNTSFDFLVDKTPYQLELAGIIPVGPKHRKKSIAVRVSILD